MVKRKHVATKQAGHGSQPAYTAGSSKGPTKDSGKRPVVEPNEEVERKKREREEEERIEKAKWVKKMKNRVFNCERQVDLTKMEDHPAVESIVRQGLRFFFEERGMYRKKMVKTFYENMVVHKLEHEIISMVGGQRVVVTHDSIAEYLHYRRPNRDAITYPRQKWDKPLNEQVHILTDDPSSFDVENETYVVGRLKEKYRALNKILHCNLTPFSNERTPSRKDGEKLVVFGSETDVVDWARRIWNGIRDFRERGGARGKIPFPLMISAMCEKAKCKPASGDDLVPGSPGPITAGSWNKSKSLSKTRAETIASSNPTAKKGVARVNQYCEILHARQQVIMDDHREIKAGQRRQKRKMGKLMRMVRWLVQCETARSEKEYVETEEDKEPDTSDSEESFDFAGEEEDDEGEYHEDEDEDEDDDE